VIVKKNEKKGYNPFRDDIYSIKDLIEEKRKEIRELESRLRSLVKTDFNENDGESERDKLKRQVKRLEKELKSLQRKL
jgi:predicted RNase H-like nuclease (RuvC/YqgF family)